MALSSVLTPRNFGRIVKNSARNPWSLLAKASIPAFSIAGFWIKIPDGYPTVIGTVLSLIAVIAGVRYISKFTVPQAFAVNYFKSFVEPMGEALRSGGAELEYKDHTTGKPTKIVLDPRKVNARLEIILPKNLSIGDDSSQSGLYQRQKDLMSKPEGNIHLPASRAGRIRGFTVHFELNDNNLTLFDVPNNLNPLREIQYEDEPSRESSQLEKRATHALKEYSDELQSNLTRFEGNNEMVQISKA